MSNIEKQALRVPEREKHDWSHAVMRDCDFCQQWALTVKHDEGGCICASCCDSEYTSSLSCALVEAISRVDAAEKRIAELEAKKVTIKLPKSFYPDGDIGRPLVINEYQIIEAIVAADCKPIAVCPRCKRELDLTHKPDGAHYCHPAAAGKGE